jgi:hypothetical protein
MPVIFMKSGGTVTCTGYTIKDGVVKAMDCQLEGTTLIPEDKSKPAEFAVSLANVLYILPGKL